MHPATVERLILKGRMQIEKTVGGPGPKAGSSDGAVRTVARRTDLDAPAHPMARRCRPPPLEAPWRAASRSATAGWPLGLRGMYRPLEGAKQATGFGPLRLGSQRFPIREATRSPRIDWH